MAWEKEPIAAPQQRAWTGCPPATCAVGLKARAWYDRFVIRDVDVAAPASTTARVATVGGECG